MLLPLQLGDCLDLRQEVQVREVDVAEPLEEAAVSALIWIVGSIAWFFIFRVFLYEKLRRPNILLVLPLLKRQHCFGDAAAPACLLNLH